MTYEIHVKLTKEEMADLAMASEPEQKVLGVWYPVVYGIENGRMKEAIHAIGKLEFKNPGRIYRIIEIHYQSRCLESTAKRDENE